MPELDWDKTDFLECFEVEPEFEEFYTSYSYSIIKNNLQLMLTVWQFESVIQISILRAESEEEVMGYCCFVRGPANYVKDRGEFIELQNCIISPQRFGEPALKDLFNSDKYPVGVDVQIAIKPDISVKMYQTKG